MEKKYTLQDLAALLAERESLPLEQAEDFVRSFFELTEEGLLKDSFVKVTGFGTFKLVEVSERESVNINTGERFQISGHNKISFTPDGTLRELVNRPFAHFTTVTLNDKTPEAALEEAERPLAEESTESSATSSHTPQPTAETPVASSTSCETNTTAPVEEEQQPDVATEKAEENVVPAVEATTFAPTSAHATVATEAPSHEVSAEQAHEEVENNQSVSTAPAATTTSSLLLRPTPAPIIDGALLVSQTPTPVLNNEQLSELLSHTPDDTAATAENSDEEESNVPPVFHDSEEETNEKRFEENEVHETCVTTAEEEEETHEEEEEAHDEATTLPEEDPPLHTTTYEEHTVDPRWPLLCSISTWPRSQLPNRPQQVQKLRNNSSKHQLPQPKQQLLFPPLLPNPPIRNLKYRQKNRNHTVPHYNSCPLAKHCAPSPTNTRSPNPKKRLLSSLNSEINSVSPSTSRFVTPNPNKTPSPRLQTRHRVQMKRPPKKTKPQHW